MKPLKASPPHDRGRDTHLGDDPHEAAKRGRMRSSDTRLRASARGRTETFERKDPPMMATTRDKVTDAAGTVKPFVDRALRDEELRQSVRNAYESARLIYDELMVRRGLTGAAARVATDKHIQAELRSAIEELRRAAVRVQAATREEEEHAGRNTALLLTGLILGVLFNPLTGPQTRKWLADRMFGSDEFTYQGDNGAGS